jgi:type VI secretion system protein ImpH
MAGQYGSFNVFQLMRLLLRCGRGRNWPTGERLRFRAELGAGFQGSEITRLVPHAVPPRPKNPAPGTKRTPQRVTLQTSNYCIASELGPLPAPFLEWLRDQQRDGGSAMSDFVNVFNQRIHVLRYELKQRSLRALDPALPADTQYAAQLASLMGLGLPDQQKQIPLPMRAWLGMAGLLINNRRSADVVSMVVSRYLGVPVQLEALVGRWRDIEPADRSALGSRQQRLGRSTLLGQRMWDRQSDVRLVVSRMRFDRVLSLLPLRASRAGEKLPPSRHAPLASLIHLLLDRRHDCDVLIDVDTDSIPASHLQKAGQGTGLRLGQTAWLLPERAALDEAISPSEKVVPVSRVQFRVNAYDIDLMNEVAA